MLRSLWNKIAYCSAYLGQVGDQGTIRQCDNEIEAARKGYQMVGVGNTYGAIVYQVDLTPEQADKLIAQRNEQKAEAASRMENRRAAYGLKF